ncbi:hypothetical protein DPMN_075800, partial [Dreissena polymorpha]
MEAPKSKLHLRFLTWTILIGFSLFGLQLGLLFPRNGNVHQMFQKYSGYLYTNE